MLKYWINMSYIIYALILMYWLLGCRMPTRKRQFTLAAFCLFLLVFYTTLRNYMGDSRILRLYPLFIHVPVLIFYLNFSKHKAIKVVFVHLTVFFLCVPPLIVVTGLGMFYDLSENFQKWIVLGLLIVCLGLVYKFLRPPLVYMIRNTDKNWYFFSIIPLLYFALAYFTTMANSTTVDVKAHYILLAFSFFLTLSAYGMILFVFKQTKQQFTLQSEHDILQIKIHASEVHLDTLKSNQQQMRYYRHDMRHHLNLLNAYMADENMDAAKNYIQQIATALDAVQTEIYCANYAINLILTSYLSKALQNDIQVDTHIHIPEQIQISDMDLCVIFSNAIENAITACLKIQDPKERRIHIQCKTIGEQYIIQLTNTYAEAPVFENHMPINNASEHGFGTKSIVSIVEKHKGFCSFVAEAGQFKLHIMLSA